MPGRFADGFGIVIERVELLKEPGEGVPLARGEGHFPGRESLQGGNGLEQCGGSGHGYQGRRARGPGCAEPAQDGGAVGGGGEGLAHVAAVWHGLGQDEDLAARLGGVLKKGDVLRELFRFLEFVHDDNPSGCIRPGADDRGHHGAAGGRADAGELEARCSGDGHEGCKQEPRSARVQLPE